MHELHDTEDGPLVQPASRAAAAAAVSALAAAAPDGDGEDQRTSHDSHDSSGSNGGSNAHLHGILLNGPNSRSRSPAHGVSPSGSMKSVRFSFEGLDGSQGAASDADQEHQHDQKGGRRSSSNSRLGSSFPTSRSQGRGGSEWLRHTLYEQLSSHSPRSLGDHHHVQEQPYSRSRNGSRDGSGSGSRGHLASWHVSSHPPAFPRGAGLMGRFAEQRRTQHADRLREQQRQLRQREAAKEVAALTAAAANRSHAQRGPVHPIFGTMQMPAGGGAAGGAGGKAAAE